MSCCCCFSCCCCCHEPTAGDSAVAPVAIIDSPAASSASVTAEISVAAVNAIETAYAAVADVSLKGGRGG